MPSELHHKQDEKAAEMIRSLYKIDCNVYELRHRKRRTAYVIINEENGMEKNATSQSRLRKNDELRKHIASDLKSNHNYRRVLFDIDEMSMHLY